MVKKIAPKPFAEILFHLDQWPVNDFESKLGLGNGKNVAAVQKEQSEPASESAKSLNVAAASFLPPVLVSS